MCKKVRCNRKFESLFELAGYLNYYFVKNPEATLSMNDLKKIVDNNPEFCLEEQTITNSDTRPILSDSEGHTMQLAMRPAFIVYEDDVEEEEPEEEEPEEEDDPSEEEDEAEPEKENDFDWVKPGERMVWKDPRDDKETPVTVVEVKSEDGKVVDSNTEIVVHTDDNPDEKFSIFSDEIVMEDDEPSEEEEEPEEEPEEEEKDKDEQ